MKVWIDQDLCLGDSLCEEIAPDVFVLLDDGLAYVLRRCQGFAPVKGNTQGAQGLAGDPVGQEDIAVEAAGVPGECVFIEPLKLAGVHSVESFSSSRDPPPRRESLLSGRAQASGGVVGDGQEGQYGPPSRSPGAPIAHRSSSCASAFRTSPRPRIDWCAPGRRSVVAPGAPSAGMHCTPHRPVRRPRPPPPRHELGEVEHDPVGLHDGVTPRLALRQVSGFSVTRRGSGGPPLWRAS